MILTYWRCDTCGEYHHVFSEDEAGVMEVIDLVSDDHRAISPECPGSYRDIQVTLEQRDEDDE